MSPLSRSPLHHVALFLDGSRVGDVRGVEGLEMEADVVTNDLGIDLSKKHVSAIRWTPAIVTVGVDMGAPCAAWLHGALARRGLKLAGEVVVSDANGHARSGVAFVGATLTRFTVPALDAVSHQPAALLLEFQAEQVHVVKGDGSDIRSSAVTSKPWLCSGFRIEIGSLPCARVVRIEGLTWTVSMIEDPVSPFRRPTFHPGRVEVGDIQLSIASADFESWESAAKKWFVDGAHLEADEMPGCITLLASDGSELAALSLSGVGFRRFPSLDLDANGRFGVTLYVETISFELKN